MKRKRCGSDSVSNSNSNSNEDPGSPTSHFHQLLERILADAQERRSHQDQEETPQQIRQQLQHVDDWSFQVDAKFHRITVDGNEQTPRPWKRQYIRREICFHLPPFLTPQLWVKHGYSVNQVLKLIRSFKPIYLWHLALWLRIPICNGSTLPMFNDPTSFAVTCKSQARQILSKYIRRIYPTSIPNMSRPNLVGKRHKPSLPCYEVGTPLLQEAKDLLKNVIPPTQLRTPILFPKLISFRGETWVPYAFEPRLKRLAIARVIPLPLYFDIYGVPDCLALDPLYISISDEDNRHLYCATSEFVYFTSPATTT